MRGSPSARQVTRQTAEKNVAEHIFKLLGVVNKGASQQTVHEKYVIQVTADQLSALLQYERKGTKKKDSPFKITSSSVIQIDKKIQRGSDPQGYLQQQPSKIIDIAKTLLGDPSASMRHVYLGALVWNVRRPGGTLEVTEMFTPGGSRPPEYRLRVETDAIYLTDSAHRHFGIVEALRMWKEKPNLYPRFRASLEFSVEIYNLDLIGESELFFELNGKQKKASPAKLRELDMSSPIGALRNAVLACDARERKLLENNIEVTAVQNKHTLMTMSVFVSTLAEVFSTDEIKDAREQEDCREDFAQYYCEFLYKLADTLTVRCDIAGHGQDEDVHPYWNLHADIIKPAIDQIQPESPDESQKRIAVASEKATLSYDRLRMQDISNHNATIKALFRIAGLIRSMDGWRTVIDRLQMDLVVPSEGKFFQKANPDWFATSGGDVPIASLNIDGSINLQVQTKNINKLHGYLREKLLLTFPPIVSTRRDGSTQALSPSGAPFVWCVNRDTDNIKTFEIRFVAILSTQGYEDICRLGVESEEWKAANFKGGRRLSPTSIQRDDSYTHEAYPDLVRYTAYFEVKLPSATRDAKLKLTFIYPELDRTELKTFIEVTATLV